MAYRWTKITDPDTLLLPGDQLCRASCAWSPTGGAIPEQPSVYALKEGKRTYWTRSESPPSSNGPSPLRDWRRWLGDAEAVIWRDMDRPEHAAVSDSAAQVAPQGTVTITAKPAIPTHRWRPVSYGPSKMVLKLGDIIARSDTSLGNLDTLAPQRKVDLFKTRQAPYLTVSISSIGGNGWSGSTVKAFCEMIGISGLTVYRKALVIEEEDDYDYEYPSPSDPTPPAAHQGVQAGNPAAASVPYTPRWTRIDNLGGLPTSIHLRAGDVIVHGELTIYSSLTLPRQPDVQPFLKGQKLYLTIDTYSPSTDKGNCWGDGSHTLAGLRATLSRDDLSVWRDVNAVGADDELDPSDEDAVDEVAASTIPDYEWVHLCDDTPEQRSLPLQYGDMVVHPAVSFTKGLAAQPQFSRVVFRQSPYYVFTLNESWFMGNHTPTTIDYVRESFSDQSLQVWRDLCPRTVLRMPGSGTVSPTPAPTANPYQWTRLDTSSPKALSTKLLRGDVIVRAGDPVCRGSPFPEQDDVMAMKVGRKTYVTVSSWTKTLQGARDYMGDQTIQVYRDANPSTVGIWSGMEAPKASRREYRWVRLPDSDPALTYLTKGDMVVRAGGSFKPIRGWRPDEGKVSTVRLRSGGTSYAILTQSYDLLYLRTVTDMDDLIAYRDSTYPKASFLKRAPLSSYGYSPSDLNVAWDDDAPKVALRSKGNDHQAVPLPLP